MPTDQDERYIVIDGRRWRRSDPHIPEALRSELVRALMSARRAVGRALRAQDKRAERAARKRVSDAKHALGERGERAELRKRAAATIRALLEQRGPDKTICPSDVARVLAGDDFRAHMALVREVAQSLCRRGQLRVLQRGREVDPARARGPIRLAR